jgi:hypothetical protein
MPKGPKSGRASLKTRKGRASLKTRKGRASLKTGEGLVQGKVFSGKLPWLVLIQTKSLLPHSVSKGKALGYFDYDKP